MLSLIMLMKTRSAVYHMTISGGKFPLVALVCDWNVTAMSGIDAQDGWLRWTNGDLPARIAYRAQSPKESAHGERF